MDELPQAVARSGYYVGKSHWPNELFTGEMRDLLLWDYAMSEAQLDALRLYNRMPAGVAAPLIEMMRSSCDVVSPAAPPISPPPSSPSFMSVPFLKLNAADAAGFAGDDAINIVTGATWSMINGCARNTHNSVPVFDLEDPACYGDGLSRLAVTGTALPDG